MSPASSTPVPGWWQRSWPLVGIGLLSIAMWTGRIRNVLADESLVGLGRSVRLALALSFVIGGVVVLVACRVGSRSRNWRATTSHDGGEWRIGPGVPDWGQVAVRVLAAWTVVVWSVQGIGILVDPNHDAGFKAIHTTLMVGSLVVAGTALWGVRRSWSVASPSRAA